MATHLTTVDAFTDTAFSGNPAAVCVLDAPRNDSWMQAVAREMNLAETAFLVRSGDEFGLRWFTPAVEVDLCGHATLASAHVLWENGHLAAGKEARFHTRSGLLTATRQDSWITLDFPATSPVPCDLPPELLMRSAPRFGSPPAPRSIISLSSSPRRPYGLSPRIWHCLRGSGVEA
jgi:PhzF family phenazine biosynthesis protein